MAEGALKIEDLATMSWLMSTLTRCPGMLTCREMEDFLADYCDDKLSWRQSAVFRLHLMMCAACRAYVDAYQRARALAKATLPLRDAQGAEIEVPAELIEAIMRAHQCGGQSSGNQ
ncbi:MAG: hypothetical protein Tsb0016_07540 [Sphingomonadales bacterium]